MKKTKETTPKLEDPTTTAEEYLSCQALVQQVIEGQSQFAQTLTEVTSQNEFQRQQLGQLYSAVSQLYQAVSTQCQQLLQSDATLQQELHRFQTGGPQRAMAGVFAKLFRDLLKQINELDEMVAHNENQVRVDDRAEPAWFNALRIVRDSFEATLIDWGCVPIAIELGVQEFDPEQHEAIVAEEGDVPANIPEHIIVKVKRRGWIMNEQILQYPQVVVS